MNAPLSTSTTPAPVESLDPNFSPAGARVGAGADVVAAAVAAPAPQPNVAAPGEPAPTAVIYAVPSTQQLAEWSARIDWLQKNSTLVERSTAANEKNSAAVAEMARLLALPMPQGPTKTYDAAVAIATALASSMADKRPIDIAMRARDIASALRAITNNGNA
jgi:hypothetical protein